MKISALYKSYVKSCRLTPVTSLEVQAFQSIPEDRSFCVINSMHEVITQREEPRMCMIHPHDADDALVLQAPGLSTFTVSKIPEKGMMMQAFLHGMEFLVHDQGNAASEWFSTFLRQPCRLVGFPPDRLRQRKIDEGSVMQLGAQDSSPLSILSTRSIADLQSRIADHFLEDAMERLRPSVVVDGVLVPNEEDDWPYLHMGAVTTRFRKLIQRCQITLVNPRTGVLGKEPLKTLATYRKVVPGSTKTYFGVYHIPLKSGVINVGDEVRVEL